MKQKYLSARETESILFNLDSMRTNLQNIQYENPELEDECQIKINEIEDILWKLNTKGLTNKELSKAREYVNERKLQRYITCLNAGLSESLAGGAFND